MGWVTKYSPYAGANWALHHEFASAANDDDGYVFRIRRDALAKRTRVSTRSVTRALTTMVEEGFLELIQDGGGRGRASTYRFLFPEVEPQWHPPVPPVNMDKVSTFREKNMDMVSRKDFPNMDMVSTFPAIPGHGVHVSSAPSEAPPLVLKESKEEPKSTAREETLPQPIASQGSEPNPPAGERETPKPKASAGARPIPVDWEPPPEELLKMSVDCPLVDIAFETAQIIDWALSKGEKRVDWVATWRKCLRVAQKRAAEAAATGTMSGRGRPRSSADVATDEEYAEAIARAEASENGWGI